MSGEEGTSRWRVLGERSLYDSPWVGLHLIDVVHPDGHRYDHHALRQPLPAVACVVRRPVAVGDPGTGGTPEEEVLLLWRHRLVPDAWGWEVPAGRFEPGETAEQAAARETLEETGWTVTDVRHVTGFHPIGGLGDHRFEVCLAGAGEQVGEPDPAESDRVAWVPLREVRELVREGRVNEGLSLVALMWLLSGLDEPAGRRPGS
ncbi:NUDIX hydrolase [Aquipuribacter sp. MA13-6]|uniref:NUDIX hydrolase n=1 Tax=unclassified Aquipuribacter TaxID=2635084 RepID=UPI003EED3542